MKCIIALNLQDLSVCPMWCFSWLTHAQGPETDTLGLWQGHAPTDGNGSGSGSRRLLPRRRRGEDDSSRTSTVVTAQRLFGIYLHPAPNFAYPADSIFAGHEVANRIEVQWAQWTVVGY